LTQISSYKGFIFNYLQSISIYKKWILIHKEGKWEEEGGGRKSMTLKLAGIFPERYQCAGPKNTKIYKGQRFSLHIGDAD